MSRRDRGCDAALIRLYPASLRDRFGAEMLDLFRARRVAAVGPVAVARLWIRTLDDVLRSWWRLRRRGSAASHGRSARWQALTDVRHAWKGVRRRPMLSAAAALVLAVGLAFSIAALSIVKALLFAPYPYPALDRLVVVRDGRPVEGAHQGRSLAAADLAALTQQARALSAVAIWRVQPVVLGDTSGRIPEAFEGEAVAANFFEVLGVRAWLGRTFAPGDDASGTGDGIVVSRRLWRARFAGDPQAIGKSILVNARPMTLLGVIADEDCYASGVDAWIPLVLSPADRQDHVVQRYHAVARLAAGETLATARDDAERIAARLADTFPTTNRGRHFDLGELRAEQYEFTLPLFLLVQACALLVLVLAATNVAGLLTAKASQRAREFAVRLALGASARRLFSVMMGEAVCLAAVAAGAGVLLAWAMVPAIRQLLPEGISRWVAGWPSITVDPTVIAGGCLLAVGTAVGLGCVTGWQAVRSAHRSNLADSGRSAAPRVTRARRAIVVAQVAVAMALLVCGGMVVDGFNRLSRMFDGVGPSQVVVFRLTRPSASTSADLAQFQQRVIDGLLSLPGLADAGVIQNHPASNVPCPMVPLVIDGRPVQPRNNRFRADLQTVSGGALRALNVRPIQGRLLGDADRAATERVAVVSAALALRLWPGGNPVGARVRIGEDLEPWTTIVGVVSDMRLNWYDEEARPTIYVPFGQAALADMYIVARTYDDPLPLAAAARDVVHRLDPQQPLALPRVLETDVRESMTPLRALSLLLACAGLVAVVLAALGIYAAITQAVSARWREFGLRLALGANPSDVRRLMLGHALRLTTIGILAGAPCTLIAAALLRGALFGLAAPSATVVSATAGALIAVAWVAAWVPSRAAMHVDPTTLLRAE